jgi:hypothetical protein
MSSLKILVMNTQEVQPEIIELKFTTDELYDIIVLIPALNLPLDSRYIHHPGGDHYSLYINKYSNNIEFTTVSGNNVYGIVIGSENLAVLSIDSHVEQDFVRNLKEIYPNKTILVVNRRYPSVVFYIHTGVRNSSIQKENSYCMCN